MKFTELGLAEPILRAVQAKGYETATPIQGQTIPHTLAGRDVLGCAQTGTGKTAAFALPLLHRLSEKPVKAKRRKPRALVLAPTRELAQQIADSFRGYGQHVELFGTVIYGGVGQGNQVKALQRGVDIIVATPGRLLDLIQQGHCDLRFVNTFVLDEADRMLDMGFMPDIKKIIRELPEEKQTLLFSATMPKEIRALADSLLDEPAKITVKSESPAVERIVQRVYHVPKPGKTKLLIGLLREDEVSRSIVFTRTKHGADRVAKHLNKAEVFAEAIHGDKSQGARQRALDKFRNGNVSVLVATDIAARGIDVDGITHVVNYDIARDPESHVHRIGRTARAGAEGAAISFCDPEELPFLRSIEKMIRMRIDVIGDGPVEPDFTTKRKPNGKPGAKPGKSNKPGARGPRSRSNKGVKSFVPKHKRRGGGGPGGKGKGRRGRQKAA